MNSDWNHVLLLEIRCWNRQYVCIILRGIFFSLSPLSFQLQFRIKRSICQKLLFGYALSFTSLCVIHLGMRGVSRIYCITNFLKEIIEKKKRVLDPLENRLAGWCHMTFGGGLTKFWKCCHFRVLDPCQDLSHRQARGEAGFFFYFLLNKLWQALAG